ncbi:MAG TPA: hypothetical protein VFI27_13115 [candidate division Zixibacteria bacterium]|nr:hypothetical protein [candidate division Zixibacteria bacterium]
MYDKYYRKNFYLSRAIGVVLLGEEMASTADGLEQAVFVDESGLSG